MSVPVRSAAVNSSTLPESSGARSAARSAESPSDSAVARPASRPVQGPSTARFTVRSANSLSRSSLGVRSANLPRQRHVFEEEAGGAEREEAKQGKTAGEQSARGVSVVQQPHTPSENRVGMDVRERGRAPSRVKFTPDTKMANDTGATRGSSSSSTTNDAKPRLGSDTDDPGKASSSRVGSTRGRSEWRTESMQSRSKSLDWRGGVESRGRAGIQDSTGASSRRAESLERRGVTNGSLDRRAFYKDCAEVGSLSSRIEAYRAASGSEKLTPTLGEGITGTSSLRLNSRVVRTLDRTGGERSLPLRLRSQDSLKSPVEGSNPWRRSSQDHLALGGSSKTNEVTGNQTILDRIEKLYGMSGPDDSKAKRHSAPVGDWLDNLPSDFNSTPGQRKLSSDIVFSSYTPHGPRSQMPHSIEKGGTFPRSFSQSDRKSFDDQPYFSQSISRKDPSPTQSTPVTLSSRYRGRSVERKALDHPEVGLYTKSLDRARSRLSATAQSKHLREAETPSKESSTDTVTLRLKGTSVVKDRSLKEEGSKITMDKDGTSRKAKESVTANRGDESGCKFGKSDGLDKHSRAKDSQGTSAMQNSKIPQANVGKNPTKVYSSDKSFVFSSSKTQTTPAKGSSDGAEDEDVFDTHINAMKQDNEKIKGNNPSMDSVRNTIHKFEALAQQSQTASQCLKSRRFFSTPEDPKDRGGLKKSESDHALARRTQEERNTQNKAWIARSFSVDEAGLKQDNCDKSEVGSKIGTIKSSSKDFKSIVDPQKDIYQRRKDMDEPDSSTSATAIKNTFTVRGSVKSNSFLPYLKNNHNNNSNGRTTFEGHDSATLKNISKVSEADNDEKEDDADKTPTNSPDRLPLLPGFYGQLPAEPKPQVSSVNNIHPLPDADSGPPTPPNSTLSTRGLLLNHDPKGLTDCPPLDRLSLLDKVGDSGPFSTAVARWSSDEEDEEEEDDGTQKDENSDYDSDSGESSVTITSNMSRRSFSVR